MAQYVIPEFKGEYYFLSNFHYHPMPYDTAGASITFPTVEHAFQAAKHRAMDLPEEERVAYVMEIIRVRTPTEARSIGKSAQGLNVPKWDAMKVGVMRDILLQKFTDRELEALLLGTGDAMLVEGNTWGDQFWGRCEGRGYNILGVLLMEIRGYLRLSNGRWTETIKD